MKRRDFLKQVSVVVAAAAIPIVLTGEEPVYTPVVDPDKVIWVQDYSLFTFTTVVRATYKDANGVVYVSGHSFTDEWVMNHKKKDLDPIMDKMLRDLERTVREHTA